MKVTKTKNIDEYLYTGCAKKEYYSIIIFFKRASLDLTSSELLKVFVMSLHFREE